MIEGSRLTRRVSARMVVPLIILTCFALNAAIASGTTPYEAVGLQYSYTYKSCTGSQVVDPINVVWEGGEPTPGTVGKVLSNHGWGHNDNQSPILKAAEFFHAGGVDHQVVHTTDGSCRLDDTQRATGNPVGNRNHVRLFSTFGNGKLWVVGDAHHDQVEGAWEGCVQVLVGGHITSSFNEGREALKNAWPASSKFVTWGNTFEITQCNGEKKHSDGKVLYLNSAIAGIAGYDPENIQEPTISGSPSAGSTISVNPGTWTGNPSSFVYQWCQVEAYEDNCAPISGATAKTWQPSSGYVGKLVGVTVRPAGADESDSVLSQLVEIGSPPWDTTEYANDVLQTEATLHATVAANGTDTHYYFEYGESTAYGNIMPVPPGSDAGSEFYAVPVATRITGLKPGHLYHYRINASNGLGMTVGEDRWFYTLPESEAKALNASGVQQTQATLMGTVYPGGLATAYRFEYGLTESYGTNTPTVKIGSGTTTLTESYTVNQLRPDTTYHFRIFASNSSGTFYGGDKTFTTKPRPVVFYNLTGGLNESWMDETGSWNWTYWQDNSTGSPALAVDSGGQQFVYFNAGGTLYERQRSGGSSTITSLGVSLTGSPAAVVAPDGERYIFYNHNGVLYETWLNWQGWNTASLGHSISSDPAVMVNPANDTFVFYNYNGMLRESWYNNKSWEYQSFEPSTGMIGKPAVGEAANGEQYVFYNRSGVLYQTWRNWQGWNTQSLGHGISSSPGVAVNSNSDQYVFYNYNGTLQESWWDGTSPWNYRYWGSQNISDTPSVNVEVGDNEGWVFFASNGALEEGHWLGTTFTFEGKGHGISASDSPSSAVNASG